MAIHQVLRLARLLPLRFHRNRWAAQVWSLSPMPRTLKAGASPPSGPDVLTLADCSASVSIFAETTPSLPIFFVATRWRLLRSGDPKGSG